MDSFVWQTSSYSGANADCLEARAVDGLIELRESDDGEIIVRTTPLKFAKFLQGIKAGEFDHLTDPAV
ncbi:DUF397 domain-containing protein [Kitasatospora sp. NPDC005748]|uniref:DUF397 domain-containing protein n=1 Tax=Kitasatospora sp. NPDC005748 TaxID=3157063 RepID=UPI00340A84F0